MPAITIGAFALSCVVANTETREEPSTTVAGVAIVGTFSTIVVSGTETAGVIRSLLGCNAYVSLNTIGDKGVLVARWPWLCSRTPFCGESVIRSKIG